MENRFFDIDNNIYLNGLYVVALIGSEMNTYKIEVVNLANVSQVFFKSFEKIFTSKKG